MDKEIKRGTNENMFAATPPLEAKECLFSHVMASFTRMRCRNPTHEKKLFSSTVARPTCMFQPADLFTRHFHKKIKKQACAAS